MKKIICFMLTAAIVLTPTSIAFANGNKEGYIKQQTISQQNQSQKHLEKWNEKKQELENKQQEIEKKLQNKLTHVKKQSFKINGSPVVKYGRYKLPINPIVVGMGATVKFDKDSAVLTVVKDTNTIVIDFKNKTVTVNGVADTTSGIFTATNNHKMTVLIKYVAKVLGVRADVNDDKVIIQDPSSNGTTPTPTPTPPVTSVSGSALQIQ